ncbi:MAG TPA: hypothetical protein V6D26_29535 [Stenomitos sp.]
MTTAFVVSTEAAFANPSNEIIPTKLANLPGQGLQRKIASGGRVVPSPTTIAGYSLADMAQALANFSTNSAITNINDPSYLPQTPFQILYLKNPNTDTTNSFTVPRDTYLFVPIANINTVPPIIGNFPSDPNQAKAYVVSQEQLGGKFEITVDGRTTPIPYSYVAGPVYANQTGYYFIQVGVFLTPLSPGEHTITCRGIYDGKAVTALTGGVPYSYEFTYTVTVQ